MKKNIDNIRKVAHWLVDMQYQLESEGQIASWEKAVMAAKVRQTISCLMEVGQELHDYNHALSECKRISEDVSKFLVDVFGDYEIYNVSGECRDKIVKKNEEFRNEEFHSDCALD